MSSKNKLKQSVTESVKIKTEIINLVREQKKISKIPIGSFFELAAVEKLNKKTNE